MRPLGVIFNSARGSEPLGIPDAPLDLHSQELLPGPPEEALRIAIVPRAHRLDLKRANAHHFEPAT